MDSPVQLPALVKSAATGRRTGAAQMGAASNLIFSSLQFLKDWQKVGISNQRTQPEQIGQPIVEDKATPLRGDLDPPYSPPAGSRSIGND